MPRIAPLALLASLLVWSACSDHTSSTPASSSPSVDLTGTYGGDITVQGNPARMTWIVAQNGTALAGSVVVTLPTGIVLMNGSLAGTVSGSNVTYTISVAPGGIPSQPACSGQLGGAANVTPGPLTLTGTYNLIGSTCASPITSGSFVLRR